MQCDTADQGSSITSPAALSRWLVKGCTGTHVGCCALWLGLFLTGPFPVTEPTAACRHPRTFTSTISASRVSRGASSCDAAGAGDSAGALPSSCGAATAAAAGDPAAAGGDAGGCCTPPEDRNRASQWADVGVVCSRVQALELKKLAGTELQQDLAEVSTRICRGYILRPSTCGRGS